MKVGKYQIGRFHAIIRKEYEDGSVDYEPHLRILKILTKVIIVF